MSIVSDILQDELKRLRKLEKKYLSQIKKLPLGSISLKKRGSQEYAYLAYRKDSKVKFDYLGRSDSDSVHDLSAQINERKKYEKLLKKVSRDIMEIEKAIKSGK
jgi:hypothetical protein